MKPTLQVSEKQKIFNMKIIVSVFIVFMALSGYGCKNTGGKGGAGIQDISSSDISGKLLRVGTNIISEIIVKPASADDPWELEKVSGFNGEVMFMTLLKKIQEGSIQVYDCISGEELGKDDARKILNETGSDVSMIAKLQFTEDWYFNPETNEIIKKVKSVSLGYESLRADGLPPAYLPYFRINSE